MKQLMKEIKALKQLEQEQGGLYPYQVEYLQILEQSRKQILDN